jgi:hypothetical protein
LANCRFGIVVLSKPFFRRNWTQYELNGLLGRQMAGPKTVLPVWHEIEHAEIAARSPSLADLYAVSTQDGIDKVADSIIRAYERALSIIEDPAVEAPGAKSILSWDERIKFPLADARRTQLLTDQPDYWEYFLFADALTRGLAEHESKWRDHQLRLVRPHGQHVPSGQVGDYVERSTQQVAGMLSNVSLLLNPTTTRDTFGSEERSGDPIAIEHLAQRVMEVYGYLLDWAAAMRSTRCSNDHERLFDLLGALADQPVQDFRAFVERCATEIGNIPPLLAGSDDEPMTLTLDLTLTADDKVVRACRKEQKRLRRRGKL